MPCFRNELLTKLSTTKGRQFHQAGVEIIGSSAQAADLEIVLLALEGLTSAGVSPSSVLVRIGSVELFNALCEDTHLNDVDTLTAKDLLDTIAEARAGKETERLAPSLTALFALVGTATAEQHLLTKWEAISGTHVPLLDNDFARLFDNQAEIASLNWLATEIRASGFHCAIDPAVVRSHEYYTGIVYEIDICPLDRPPLVEVAGGGRYNRLIGKFLGAEEAGDVSIPAVGFAFGIERIMQIMGELDSPERKVGLSLTYSLDTTNCDLVIAGEDHRATHELARQRRTDGSRVDVYAGEQTEDVDALEAYAAQRGGTLMRIG
jgi:histidyl-tRNA synthetase